MTSYRKPFLRATLWAIVALAASIPWVLGQAQETQTRTLEVKLMYQGAGEVSADAPLHLYLFDSPDFASGGVIPIVFESSTENGKVISIPGILEGEIYAVAAYGNYAAESGPPPTGTPVAVYLPPGATGIAPIRMDQEKVTIEFNFDDSIRMP